MSKYVISYSGDTSVEIEAESPEEAEEKFWADGLNDLNNAEIDEITEVSNEG